MSNSFWGALSWLSCNNYLSIVQSSLRFICAAVYGFCSCCNAKSVGQFEYSQSRSLSLSSSYQSSHASSSSESSGPLLFLFCLSRYGLCLSFFGGALHSQARCPVLSQLKHFLSSDPVNFFPFSVGSLPLKASFMLVYYFPNSYY